MRKRRNFIRGKIGIASRKDDLKESLFFTCFSAEEKHRRLLEKAKRYLDPPYDDIKTIYTADIEAKAYYRLIQLNDLEKEYAEWVETDKEMKQRILAETNQVEPLFEEEREEIPLI